MYVLRVHVHAHVNVNFQQRLGDVIARSPRQNDLHVCGIKLQCLFGIRTPGQNKIPRPDGFHVCVFACTCARTFCRKPLLMLQRRFACITDRSSVVRFMYSTSASRATFKRNKQCQVLCSQTCRTEYCNSKNTILLLKINNGTSQP